MQFNNNFFKGMRKTNRIATAIVLLIVGLLVIGLGIALFFLKDAETGEASNPIINIVLMVVGLSIDSIAVFMFINAKKTIARDKPLTEEEIKNIQAKDKEAIKLTDTKLFFHFGGKMNQSYIVENQDKAVVYDVKLTKFNPFASDTFDLINHELGTSKTIKVSKVLTTESDGLGVNMINTSGFKIDGVNCWDYLKNKGYEIQHNFNSSTLARFEINYLGKHVASIVPTSMKDPWNEESQNILATGRGIYRLEIKEANLDDVVIIAFIIARVNIIE